ncbi:hypothetical protein BT63DRAFT_411052 [Microthyrium microscopicum]|uniref:Uncharacterized protein n=1 Tax=Microthyrium microscopicum TaxID=703497 RepID=A0A6A6UJN8_9PEZI|nr:hypothetical protein BT63DRAFT_411052 [Microthyrium microscopicum]
MASKGSEFYAEWNKNPASAKDLGIYEHHCWCRREMTNCLGAVEHMVMCKKFHGTPLRDGNHEKCKSCNQSYEMRQQRLKDVADKLFLIEKTTGDFEVTPPTPRRRSSYFPNPSDLLGSKRERKASKAQAKRKSFCVGTPSKYLERVEAATPSPQNSEILQDFDSKIRYQHRIADIKFTDSTVLKALLEDRTAPNDFGPVVSQIVQLLRPKQPKDRKDREITKLYKELEAMVLEVLQVDQAEDVETRRRRHAYTLWALKR